MSRRGFKTLLLLYPIPSTHSLRSNPLTTLPYTALKLSHQNFFCFVARYTAPPSSSDDDLEGLIDPDDSFSAESSLSKPVSPQEFSFLRDSLLASDSYSGSSVQSLNSGKSSNEAILISDAIHLNNDEFGEKTQKYLGQFREKLNPDLVVDVLNIMKNPELGVKFFIWAGRQIGYSHTRRVYTALLEILERGNNNRLPDHYLIEIKGDDNEVLGNLLNVLIRKCCRNGLWNLALEELGRLKDFGYKPSRLTYNALIQVFLRADQLETAHLVHREMSDSGFRMDELTLGIFVHSLCRTGKWREAFTLLEKEEFIPSTVLYTQMISGLCEASLFEEAMDVLNRMRSSFCIPNVVTYRTLLCGCLRKKQLGRCKRILSMMISEGCYPSPRIFNSLVHAYCRTGDYSYAYKLLKKMVNCGCKPGYVVYNILIGGICGNSESPSPSVLELAEKAYSEMLDEGVVLNKINVVNFASCLCGAGKYEKAHDIVREMMDKGFIPDTSTYSKVIGFLCNASRVEKAYSLFGEMKRIGVVPDVYTYTVLIDSFCKAGLIEQAHNWLDEMVRDGCVPNVVTYTTLIHSYLKARKVSIANELFEMMLSKGCIPNVVTYTALIDGYCKSGDVEKACQIYARMRGNMEITDVDVYFSIEDTKNNTSEEPNVITYGALVDGLCKAHKVKQAHELLDVMLVQGCEPNIILYDALIDGFCKAGKLDEAQQVFAKMTERGYNPSVYTYSSLIDRLFKDKRLDLVVKVLSKMLENSCAPNVVIYTEMIDGLCKAGKTDEAYKLMLMMEEKGCNPNVVTYTAMIDGFGKAGKIEKCLELFGEMGSKVCSPNFVTYRVMISHCCAAGKLDKAHKLLDEMKQTYWPKHLAGYRKVIEGFNRDFITSLGLLQEISENNSAPVVSIYRVLVDNFVRAGRLEVAMELYEEIKSAPISLIGEKNMVISLIESLCLANKVDKAFQLYADMIGGGNIPELGTFVYLVKGLVKVNRWEEAMQLCDSMCQMDIHWIQQEGAT